MSKQYRKKPVVVNAIQFLGLDENKFDVCEFFRGSPFDAKFLHATDQIEITTLEGVMTASRGDYIIKGVMGEFYPCKPAIFELTYEPADLQPSRKEHLQQAVQTLEQFANQLRMMEEPDQLLDGAFLADCVPEMYGIVERNNL